MLYRLLDCGRTAFFCHLLLAAGESPIQVYSVMLGGAFGSLYGLGETIVKMIPLMILSVGISFAFKNADLECRRKGSFISELLQLLMVLHLQGYDRKNDPDSSISGSFCLCRNLRTDSGCFKSQMEGK